MLSTLTDAALAEYAAVERQLTIGICRLTPHSQQEDQTKHQNGQIGTHVEARLANDYEFEDGCDQLQRPPGWQAA